MLNAILLPGFEEMWKLLEVLVSAMVAMVTSRIQNKYNNRMDFLRNASVTIKSAL